MENDLPRFLHSYGNDNSVEGTALYAEYALYAAAQTIWHTLLAALYAIGLQMDAKQGKVIEEVSR